MLNAKIKILGVALVSALGVAAYAQSGLDPIVAAYWAGKGVVALLSLTADFVVLVVEKGHAVYKKAQKSDYPELKPGINCFGMNNSSNSEWTLKVPKGDDPKEKTNPDLDLRRPDRLQPQEDF